MQTNDASSIVAAVQLPEEQAVITHLPLSGDGFGTDDDRAAVRALEACIEQGARSIGAEYDGNEFGGGEAVLYSYGPNADQLFDVINMCVAFSDVVRPGAYAIKRYGRADDATAQEVRVELHPAS